MAKYLFIYRSEPMKAPPSPAEMQAALAQWGSWIGKFAASGNMHDGGDGLKPEGKVVHAGGIVTDGPFIETKEVVAGYSIIKADSYDKAAAIAKECPVVLFGGTVEIRELAGYN